MFLHLSLHQDQNLLKAKTLYLKVVIELDIQFDLNPEFTHEFKPNFLKLIYVIESFDYTNETKVLFWMYNLVVQNFFN